MGCHSHTAVNQTSPDRSPFVLTKQCWTSHVLVHVPMTSLAYEVCHRFHQAPKRASEGQLLRSVRASTKIQGDPLWHVDLELWCWYTGSGTAHLPDVIINALQLPGVFRELFLLLALFWSATFDLIRWLEMYEGVSTFLCYCVCTRSIETTP